MDVQRIIVDLRQRTFIGNDTQGHRISLRCRPAWRRGGRWWWIHRLECRCRSRLTILQLRFWWPGCRGGCQRLARLGRGKGPHFTFHLRPAWRWGGWHRWRISLLSHGRYSQQPDQQSQAHTHQQHTFLTHFHTSCLDLGFGHLSHTFIRTLDRLYAPPLPDRYGTWKRKTHGPASRVCS